MQPGQEVKSLDVGVSICEGHVGQLEEGPGMGRPRAGWGGSSHLPLLATNVMLLHRVAEEGSPGASDDSRLPGVHVEGVCEPWRGEEGGQAGGGVGHSGLMGPTGRSWL